MEREKSKLFDVLGTKPRFFHCGIAVGGFGGKFSTVHPPTWR